MFPDTFWGLDLLLAAASSAASQQFPLFIPCRVCKFFSTLSFIWLSPDSISICPLRPRLSPTKLLQSRYQLDRVFEWEELGNFRCLDYRCPLWVTLPPSPPPPCSPH